MSNFYGTYSNDKIIGTINADLMTGNDGNDTINGAGGNDTIQGENGNDFLGGSDGNDQIRGGNGDDSILGGAGIDRLYGDYGHDVLTGGTGADSFAYFYWTDSGITVTTRDIITDFSHLQGDKIVLSDIDANPLMAGDQAFKFIGAAAFTGVGQVRFDPTTHVLTASNDADTAPEFSILLSGVNKLVVTDLIL